MKNKTSKHFAWYGAEVHVKDDFIEKGVSIKNILKKVESSIPTHLLRGLDAVYVGEFQFLKDRALDAAYESGAIFVSNQKKSENECADDVVHEIAHLVEQEYGEIIYSDGSIRKEFIKKRKELWNILTSEGYEINLRDFINTEYEKTVDLFLYQIVGYPALSVLTVNLFYSPYGATSMREYFANCFEAFFWDKDVSRVKQISPKVFDKLTKLLYYKEDEV